jgi:hypothetical protein
MVGSVSILKLSAAQSVLRQPCLIPGFDTYMAYTHGPSLVAIPRHDLSETAIVALGERK